MRLVLPLENGFPDFDPDFDPERPGSEVEVVKLRNLSQHGFFSFLAGRNAEFAVTPEDYPSRDVSKMIPADVELRDGATYIVLPRKGKNHEQTVSTFTLHIAFVIGRFFTSSLILFWLNFTFVSLILQVDDVAA